MEDATGIKRTVTKSEITVTNVYASEYQADKTLTAEIRQTIKTVSEYPEKAIVNSLQDNIFSVEDFEFETNSYDNEEIRVAWLTVPEGTTIKDVEEKLKKFPNACLYRILNNHPILTTQQQYAIGDPSLNVTKDVIANRQVIRFGEGSSEAGKLVLDNNNKVQYRSVFFSSEEKEDIDYRNAELKDFYSTPEIDAEMVGNEIPAVEGQEL